MGVYKNVIAENYEAKMKEVKSKIVVNDMMTYMSFYSVANSAFKWKGLQGNILPYQPEEFMIYWGKIGRFIAEGEEKILPIYGAGSLMENGRYDEYFAIAKNGKTYRVKYENLEICDNNSMELPTSVFIDEYAKKCTYALSAVETTLERACFPDIIAVYNKAQADSLSKALDKKETLIPFKIANLEGFKNDMPNVIPAFDSTKKDVLSLHEVYTRFRGDFYNLFGVFSVGINKNERLTESESKGNSDNVRYSLYDDMYERRMDFAERVNKRRKEEGISEELIIEKNRSIAVTQEEIEEADVLNHTSFAGEDGQTTSEEEPKKEDKKDE